MTGGKSVVIDCFAESAGSHRDADALVAVDVIRATTTAVTAGAHGHECYPAESIEEAWQLAAGLAEPIMAGELGGVMPEGFDMPNSPVAVDAHADRHRPIVLLSSSGTRVIRAASRVGLTYAACLRNVSAQTSWLVEHHSRVALIGAGARGEFREEDQYGCAVIAAGLIDAGFVAEDARTRELVERWRGLPPTAILVSNSVAFLERAGQLDDLDFVLGHLDDVDAVFAFDGSRLESRGVACGNLSARPQPF
jgi:2-phosphosulfolactate phosphatase